MPKCVVVDTGRDLGRRPRRRAAPWAETIIYEAHVKGMTARRATTCPSICAAPSPASPTRASSTTWSKLGVTAVELMPVQAFFDDRYLVEKKLVELLGLQHRRLLRAGAALRLARRRSARVQGDGAPAARGRHRGASSTWSTTTPPRATSSGRRCPSAASTTPATTCSADDQRFYFDTTGTGNTLNLRHPRVLQMVMDSLRYWVEDCHVDGFRFDLATSLGREYDRFDPTRAFFDAVRQDPVLSRVKLIAEPWDIGPNGYQVGNFPPGWAEWNGRYRDDMRSFWKGDAGLAAGARARPARLRRPVRPAAAESRGRASTSSPRMTASRSLDLYSYNEQAQRGERRGQPRRPLRQPQLELRRRGADRRSRRSSTCATACGATLMATLLLSQGTPMLLMGDEVGRTPGRQQQRLLPGQRDRLARLEGRRRRATAPSWNSCAA